MITFSNLGRYGRLGNCYFQMAATIALAVRNNDDYAFPNWDHRAHFNLPFLEKLPRFPQYEEKTFHFTPIPYQRDLDLKGYFQSDKYFSDQHDIIIDLLRPKMNFPILQNTCAIHVRRTDYLDLKDCYVIQPLSYYEEAMKAVGAKKYLIFSDDIVWCKQHFVGSQFSFVEGNAPYIDLSLMSCAEHNIIANSSFSWWSAYLNQNKSKIVVAPRNWFGPKLNQNDTKDLYPNGWVVL